MGKWTDKNYITHSEWTNSFGGSRASITRAQEHQRIVTGRIPYNHCAMSLVPFKTPVCTKNGMIFDKNVLFDYFKLLESKNLPTVNPISKDPLTRADLVYLHFESTGSPNEYRCPITKKIFNEHSHIIAIRPSGNVYSYEAVAELCLKANNFFDLLSPSIPFVKGYLDQGGDLIVLQDPKDLPTLAKRKHVIDLPTKAAGPTANVASTGITKRILSSLKAKGEKLTEESKRLGLAAPDYVYHNTKISFPSENIVPEKPGAPSRPSAPSSFLSEGRVAASFTCSSLTPITTNALQKEDGLKKVLKLAKRNGYLTLETNFGNLNLELYTKSAPKTVYNFMELAKRGYYDDVSFHRNLPGFMIQGGDPSGTGSGGKSVFSNGNFEDELQPASVLSHNKRGVVSMANHGPNTNSSQFFITYADCKHLDGKHTIFGRVVGGMAVLSALEEVPFSDGAATPKIIKCRIVENPFNV